VYSIIELLETIVATNVKLFVQKIRYCLRIYQFANSRSRVCSVSAL